MPKTRLSTKGQLIIPRKVRDRLGWSPGVELEVEDRGDHVEVRLASEWPPTTLDELIGCTGYRGPARTLEEMEAAIARGVQESR